MNRFHIIDDGAVITFCKGVYRQAKFYRRDDKLFAMHGGGFVALYRGNGTSLPNVSWKDIDPGAGQVVEDRDLNIKWFAIGMAEAAE